MILRFILSLLWSQSFIHTPKKLLGRSINVNVLRTSKIQSKIRESMYPVLTPIYRNTVINPYNLWRIFSRFREIDISKSQFFVMLFPSACNFTSVIIYRLTETMMALCSSDRHVPVLLKEYHQYRHLTKLFYY